MIYGEGALTKLFMTRFNGFMAGAAICLPLRDMLHD
jgi:hypothetical protein